MTDSGDRKPKRIPGRRNVAPERELGAALAVLESAVEAARAAARPWLAPAMPAGPRHGRGRRRLAALTHAARDCVPCQTDDLGTDLAGD